MGLQNRTPLLLVPVFRFLPSNEPLSDGFFPSFPFLSRSRLKFNSVFLVQGVLQCLCHFLFSPFLSPLCSLVSFSGILTIRTQDHRSALFLPLFSLSQLSLDQGFSKLLFSQIAGSVFSPPFNLIQSPVGRSAPTLLFLSCLPPPSVISSFHVLPFRPSPLVPSRLFFFPSSQPVLWVCPYCLSVPHQALTRP